MSTPVRRLFAATLFALALGAAPATAQSAAPAAAPAAEPYSDARFAALQRQNALILIDVAATWCPTCARQKRIIEAYQAARPNVPLHVLTVDFDDQKDAVRRFRAPRQSTLLLYQGRAQVWFSVAETRQDAIFAALDEAAAVRAARPARSGR